MLKDNMINNFKWIFVKIYFGIKIVYEIQKKMIRIRNNFCDNLLFPLLNFRSPWAVSQTRWGNL